MAWILRNSRNGHAYETMERVVVEKNTDVYRVENLKKLGMPECQAYRNGNTRKGYWAIAGSGILHHTITNERLARRGYYDISEAYKSMHLI